MVVVKINGASYEGMGTSWSELSDADMYSMLVWLEDGQAATLVMHEHQADQVVSELSKFEWVTYSVHESHVIKGMN